MEYSNPFLNFTTLDKIMGVFIFLEFFMSPQTRQFIQLTLYEHQLVSIEIYRDFRYNEVNYIICRFHIEDK